VLDLARPRLPASGSDPTFCSYSRPAVVGYHCVKPPSAASLSSALIVDSAPFHICDCEDLMAGKLASDLVWQVFRRAKSFIEFIARRLMTQAVVQGVQPPWSRANRWKLSRNPSIVYLPASIWSGALNSPTRVPAKQGAPCMTFGLRVTPIP